MEELDTTPREFYAVKVMALSEEGDRSWSSHVQIAEFWLQDQKEEKRMDLEDFLEPEIAIVAAVTATVFSPRVRKFLRRGAVYGMAGALMAGDAVTSFARSIGHGFQQAAASAAQAPEHAAPEQGQAQGGGASS